MHVVEIAFDSQAGSPSKPNEDFAAASPAVAVVLDGLSAPAELGTGCRHGTPWYVAELGTTLLRLATTSPHQPLADVLEDAIERVADCHATTCDLAHPGTPSSSVIVVRQVEETFEYLVLFDSVLLLETVGGPVVVTDDRVLDFAQEERDATRLHKLGSAEHATAVRALVAGEREHRNQHGGYWVAGSRPLAAGEALSGSMPVKGLTRVAAMTDGVSCFVDMYELGTWSELLDELEKSGPAGLIGQVREAEMTDLDGVRWPRYKLSDDSTVVSLKIVS